MDQLLHRSAFGPQYHIPQDILPGIIRRQVAEFPVIVFRFTGAALFYGQLRQFKQQALANGRTLKCKQQDILGFLVLLILLIYGCHHGQDIDIAHPPPVNGIRNFHGCLIVAFVYHLLNLLNFNVKLVFIHLLHLPIASSRYGNPCLKYWCHISLSHRPAPGCTGMCLKTVLGHLP